MTAKFYVTLTDYGATLVAQAHDVASIVLSEMVLGDANNIPYDPIDQKNRTALVNQRATVPVQSVVINDAVTTVTATVEANIGGFNLHEIGLKDDTGQLVYIGNYHGGYKPVIAEGAGGELTIVIDITAESGKEALISIDPNVVTANKEWVNTQISLLSTSVNNQLNNKYDKTGGNIAGDATVLGTLTAINLMLGTFSATPNGYTRLPNNLILQWGKVSDDFTSQNFPIQFPNAAFAIIAQQISGGGTSKVYVEIVSKSQFKVYEGNDATSGTEFYWFAIGN
ncbi:phage tail protein [Acinetobacter sp. NIPH 1852]|uniref:phage tail-collar fiber domain-containing protein n=1 Tax=Acinetobacter sp. NIPH 1852 TaxID=2923428 RepID=UPI001F4BAF04|nr:phage tail protein [Acinetobacter sp. NIPH 1852]MCH7306609.1 phage tail protein [Acinetobacter sp. NIPH 1852]